MSIGNFTLRRCPIGTATSPEHCGARHPVASPPLVARDRAGRTFDFVTGRAPLTRHHLRRCLAPAVERDILLVTGGHPAYRLFARASGIAHSTLNLAAGVRVAGERMCRTSTRTTAASSIGCAVSTAWPAATWPIISAGSGRSTADGSARRKCCSGRRWGASHI